MFKKFLIIIFFFSFLPLFLLSAQQFQENKTVQFLFDNNNPQKEIGQIWQKIPRGEEIFSKIQGISSKIRDFGNFTILPRLESGFWQKIETFFKERYEQRRLIIQKEIQKEKQEIIELTPPIIIETWERIIAIREFMINAKEIIKNFLKQEDI